METREIVLRWERLMELREFDSHLDFLRDKGGIYLWIFPGCPHRVTYVGETRRYLPRFVDHCSRQLGGLYTTFRIESDEDYLDVLQKHYAGKTLDEIRTDGKVYVPEIFVANRQSFARAFLDKEEWKWRARALRKYRYAFAPLSDEPDSPAWKEIESALLVGLWKQYLTEAGTENLNRSGARSNAYPIGQVNKYPTCRMRIRHCGKYRECIPKGITNIQSWPGD